MIALVPTPAGGAPEFARVPMHGREVLAVRFAGEIRVPMKAFCSTLGIPWDPQRKRIARDADLAPLAATMDVPSAGGMQRQLTLPAQVIPGFLFGCEPERFDPDVREAIRLFRRECFEVLHAHFAGLERAAAVPSAELAQLRRTAGMLLQQLLDTRAPAARRHLYDLLAGCCADIGVEPPPLAAIGGDEAGLDELVAQLLEAARVLEGNRRRRWNHAREDGVAGSGRIVAAIDLPELARIFAAADVDYDVGALRVALERGSTGALRASRRTITSAITGKPVFAWIIEEWR